MQCLIGWALNTGSRRNVYCRILMLKGNNRLFLPWTFCLIYWGQILVIWRFTTSGTSSCVNIPSPECVVVVKYHWTEERLPIQCLLEATQKFMFMFVPLFKSLISSVLLKQTRRMGQDCPQWRLFLLGSTWKDYKHNIIPSTTKYLANSIHLLKHTTHA